MALGDRTDGACWSLLPIEEWAAWFEESIAQAVAGILGVQLGREEALMNAGLDSLGRLPGSKTTSSCTTPPCRPLWRLGVHNAAKFLVSTGAVELRKELARLTALDLPATLIFDYPSIAEMTAALLSLAPQPAKADTSEPQRRIPSTFKRTKRPVSHTCYAWCGADSWTESVLAGAGPYAGGAAEMADPSQAAPPASHMATARQGEDIAAQVQHCCRPFTWQGILLGKH